MKSSKILGILLLLLYVCIVAALLNDSFIKPYNLQNLLRSSSMFAIIGIGAVLVIVTGGIDLSTGSLIGLVGCTMTIVLKTWSDHPPSDNGAFLLWLIGLEFILLLGGWLIRDRLLRRDVFGSSRGSKIALAVSGPGLLVVSFLIPGYQAGPWMTMAAAVGIAILLSIHLGLLHGLLITRLKLQPFVVTLCGLMCYRGLSRYVTGDQTQGLGTAYNDSLRLWAIGKPCTATAVMLLFGIVLVLIGVFKIVRRHMSRSDSTTDSNTEPDTGAGWLLTIIGLVSGLIASSRYWDGWRVIWDESFATIGGFDLKLFTLDIPAAAIDRPAVLMGYSLWPLIACFVALTIVVLNRTFRDVQFNRRKLITIFTPLLLVAAALFSVFAAKSWVGSETVSLSDMNFAFQMNAAESADGMQRGEADVFLWGVNLILWKMASIFASIAGLLAGILWLKKIWTSDEGNLSNGLFLLTGFFAVMWLLSKTAIHETVVQTPFFILVLIGVIAALFLNTTVYGRYFFALGNNEEAAKFSGIKTDSMKVLAYVLCALCGGIAAVLFTLDSNNVEPSGHGSFYELYAIAAAVLGGCSLRGGEGSILGVVIGATIMRVLYNAPDMIGISSQLEMFTIGSVLMIGVIVDESARQIAASRDRSVVS